MTHTKKGGGGDWGAAVGTWVYTAFQREVTKRHDTGARCAGFCRLCLTELTTAAAAFSSRQSLWRGPARFVCVCVFFLPLALNADLMQFGDNILKPPTPRVWSPGVKDTSQC